MDIIETPPTDYLKMVYEHNGDECTAVVGKGLTVRKPLTGPRGGYIKDAPLGRPASVTSPIRSIFGPDENDCFGSSPSWKIPGATSRGRSIAAMCAASSDHFLADRRGPPRCHAAVHVMSIRDITGCINTEEEWT